MKNLILVLVILVGFGSVGCNTNKTAIDDREQTSLTILVTDTPDADGNWHVEVNVGVHRWRLAGTPYALKEGIAAHAAYVKKEFKVTAVRLSLPVIACPPDLSTALAGAADRFLD